jgi:hypothetical protein
MWDSLVWMLGCRDDAILVENAGIAYMRMVRHLVFGTMDMQHFLSNI